MKRVITFGTFDVLHVGHLNLFERARDLGDVLIVGVSTDTLSLSKKCRLPVFIEEERRRLLQALQYVDETFFENSLDEKRQYIVEHRADILVMGDDWAGKFDEFGDICRVVYLPRTPSISTTATIERIRE
jgi:glycerol-3-phosphate cytidylyltransferase